MEVWRCGSTILKLGIRWYVSDELHDPATSIPGEEHAITIELKAGFDTFLCVGKQTNFLP